MNRSVNVESIFAELGERLKLRWEAGSAGRERYVESDDAVPLRPSLVGFLNLVHPNKVQLLGVEEGRYLDGLDARKRWETLAEILAQKPVALVVTDGLIAPEDLVDQCEETQTPLFVSPLAGHDVLNRMAHFVGQELARRVTLHGVFMEVFSIGVLITGDAGAGKSELALELLSRGHRLVADDAPEFRLIAPDVLDGTCPPLLQDCLEVRGLGILNIRQMFGDSAVKINKYLRLIIHLRAAADALTDERMDRLRGDHSTRRVVDLDIPVITVPIAAGRNLAVIVEAAVRNHSLKMKGYDSAEAFIERHREFLES